MSVQVILIVVHSDGHDHDDGGDDDFNSNSRIKSDHDRNIDDLQSGNDSGCIASRTRSIYKEAKETLACLVCLSLYIYA